MHWREGGGEVSPYQKIKKSQQIGEVAQMYEMGEEYYQWTIM